jgi:hypothetical protein
MSKKVVIAFADRVLQHFPPFRWDDDKEAAWAETMVRELSGFPDDVVERAGREMVRTRKKPQTPLVSECIDACLDAKRWIEAQRQSETLSVEHDSGVNRDWTTERLKLANDLMVTPLGKQAAKEGWVGALWSFARKNSRLPQQGKEIEGCKQAAKDFDAAYALCVRGHGDARVSAALEKIGGDMLKRRHDLERRIEMRKEPTNGR